MGINAPSPIQAAAIPATLAGGNVALQSYTGSGKVRTALLACGHKRASSTQGGVRVLSDAKCARPVAQTLAYLLPVLTLALRRAEHIFRQGNGREVPVQAVVVAPSQELAMQVVRVAQSLLPPAGKNMVQQCIGGANPRNQIVRRRWAVQSASDACSLGTACQSSA